MNCIRHNKKKLDSWYDCSECSFEYYEHIETIILEMEVLSKTIHRPITYVLKDLICLISEKYNENLELSSLPKIHNHNHKCKLPF